MEPSLGAKFLNTLVPQILILAAVKCGKPQWLKPKKL